VGRTADRGMRSRESKVDEGVGAGMQGWRQTGARRFFARMLRPRLVGRGKLGLDAGHCVFAEVFEIAARSAPLRAGLLCSSQ
jgi:hypothetical protein